MVNKRKKIFKKQILDKKKVLIIPGLRQVNPPKNACHLLSFIFDMKLLHQCAIVMYCITGICYKSKAKYFFLYFSLIF